MFLHIYAAIGVLTVFLDGYLQYAPYKSFTWYSPREISVGDCLLAGAIWPLYYVLLYLDWRGRL